MIRICIPRVGTFTIIVLLAVVGVVASAAADPSANPAANSDDTYASDRRVAYLERILGQLAASSPDQLVAIQDELYRTARSQCKSDFGYTAASCLIELAAQRCQRLPEAERSGCKLLADIIVTNQLSESEFVDDGRRVELMSDSRGYRVAVRDELRGHYAALVAEFSLWSPARVASAAEPGQRAVLAESIDRFCAERARTRPLAWQRCVAAMVWYIGTTRPSEHEE